MSNLKKGNATVIALITVAIVVVLGFLFTGRAESPTVVNTQDNLGVGQSNTDSNFTTKGFTQGGGVLTVSTTTATTTLTAPQLLYNSFISIADTQSPAKFLVLPSTTTLKTSGIIPASGDSRTWIVHNRHTSTASTTQIVAGAGIDLQTNLGSTTADIVRPAGFGYLTCTRLPTTDVACEVRSTQASD